jgi:hypothetical protein
LEVQPALGKHRPEHSFSLIPNGAGFDVFDTTDYPFDMPVATVQSLPDALQWAMNLPDETKES